MTSLPSKNEDLPIQKKDFLSRLSQVHPEHDYKLTEKGKELLYKYQRFESAIDTSCVMTCPGAETCPWAQSGECPLADSGADLPVGKLCPIELLRYTDKCDELIQGVADSDPNQFVSKLEISIIKRLSAFDIQISRIQKEITRTPDATIETVVGVNADGQGITAEVPNPRYAVLRQLEQNRSSQQRQLQQAITNRQRVVKVRITEDQEDARGKKIKEVMAEVTNPNESTGGFRHKHRKQQGKHLEKIEEQASKMVQIDNTPPEEFDF